MVRQQQITDLLKNEFPQIKTLLCVGCGFIKLYDKRDQPYIVRFSSASVEDVKKLAEAINTDNYEGLKMFNAVSKARPVGMRVCVPITRKGMIQQSRPFNSGSK